MFGMKKKISGAHVPHNKHTAHLKAEVIKTPDEVLLPMNMHMGADAKVIVNVGDHVYIGTKVAEAEGRNSCPVHASISGTVVAIEDYEKTKAIRIKSDGLNEKDPGLCPHDPKDLDEFLDACKESGIVGLGGAAFPLYGKLAAAKHGHIKTVLVNGAECEPYVTSDHRTMVDDADLVYKGVLILRKYLGSEEFKICIENNKPDAIAKMKELFKDVEGVEVMELEAVYPQGAKQVLLYNAADLVVQPGQRLASLGYIIINVTTLAKMALYMSTGMPLVDRCLSLDGSAIKQPKNLLVPIGTRIGYVIDQVDADQNEVGKVIIGGPMMGHAQKNLDNVVIKATNGILCFNKKDAVLPQETACIHCGKCVETCPLSLNPVAYSRALEMDDEERKYNLLKKEDVAKCIECGCCSFVCPAARPLVYNNIQAKRFVKSYEAKLKEANNG